MRIDSHHHFWNYSVAEYAWIGEGMDVLKRDFGAEDLRAVTSAAGIDVAVSVQARQSLDETQCLLEIANSTDLIAGVVGWVPLAEAGVGDLLDEFRNATKLKAVRHVVQDEPDDEFLLRDDFNAGISELRHRDLVYDILIYARQLPAAIRFVDLHPEQPFVLDHIAKPTIRSAVFDEQWKKNLRELANRENVACKFSGVVTEVRDPDWTIATLQPYWDVALEAFGPNRLMYGSDWPVCLLKSDYQRWFDGVEQLAAPLSDSERALFFGETAKAVYGL